MAILSGAGPALIVLVFAGIGWGTQAAKSPVAGYTVENVSGGTIEGRALYAGKPVMPMQMANTEDPAYCGGTMTSYPMRVEKGGVVNAVGPRNLVP